MYTTTQIKQIERLAFEDNIPELTLMLRAGKSAYELLKRHYPDAKKVAFFCGSGNNGGDAYVMAYYCQTNGLAADCFYLKDPQELKQPALTAHEQARLNHVSIQPWGAGIDVEDHDVVVDGLLGTGFKNNLSKEYQDIIRIINQSDKPVIALDVPSGLNANTGVVDCIAIKAGHTITFIGLKTGLLTADAADYCGIITVDKLNIPKKLMAMVSPTANPILFRHLKTEYLQPRKQNTHKGDYGHVAVIGGDYGMAGAVRMAGEAAARAGAGLISVYTRPEHAPTIITARPELMVHSLPDPKALAQLLVRATVIAVGPGLGRQHWGETCLNAVLQLPQIKVIDADGLWWLAKMKLRREDWVLTPHPKEAALLLETGTESIQHNRFEAVVELQKRYGGVVILKGAGTLVCDGHDPIQVCSHGNAGMASGGMGDVLTGIVAGLLAQRIPLAAAACLGVALHAKAGDLCAKKLGQRGMLASDLFPYIRELIN